MLTIQDIMQVKTEMEEESYLTCSDMFIERLKDLSDQKHDEMAKGLKATDVMYDIRKDILSGKDDRDFSE